MCCHTIGRSIPFYHCGVVLPQGNSHKPTVPIQYTPRLQDTSAAAAPLAAKKAVAQARCLCREWSLCSVVSMCQRSQGRRGRLLPSRGSTCSCVVHWQKGPHLAKGSFADSEPAAPLPSKERLTSAQPSWHEQSCRYTQTSSRQLPPSASLPPALPAQTAPILTQREHQPAD